MIGIEHGTHLIVSHHAKREHVYFPHPNGRPPLDPWIGSFSDSLATLPPGFQVSCGINRSSSVGIIHLSSFCCPSFFFPPMQMFLYALILLPSLPKFPELCRTQSESSNIFSFVWSMLLPPTSLKYTWLFSKNKTFQPIGIQGCGEKLAVSFSDNRVFTQFLLHPHKLDLWDLVHLFALQAAPLYPVTYWTSN